MTACGKIGAAAMLVEDKNCIKTPLGAVLQLDTTHETHYKACIREACRYAIIQQLITRTAPGQRDNRKDMEEITPHVDHSATMKLLNCQAKEEEKKEENEKKWTPTRLCPKKKRTLQTMIAESIRAPHRLKKNEAYEY